MGSQLLTQSGCAAIANPFSALGSHLPICELMGLDNIPLTSFCTDTLPCVRSPIPSLKDPGKDSDPKRQSWG